MRRLALILLACSSPHRAPIANQAPARPATCRNGHKLTELAFTTQGSLDKNLVRHAIHDHQAELEACYSSYLTRGSQAGRVIATFTIIGDGRVGDARVTGFDEALANCVCEVIAQLTFLPARSPITVNYPIVFAPAPPE